jgi:hypothetical protein
MAKALEGGRIVVVTAEEHTGYTSDACVQEIVDKYLVDLVVPDNETSC